MIAAWWKSLAPLLGQLAASFLLALLLTPAARHLALKCRAVDQGGKGRRRHLGDVPRLGGLAIVLSFALPLLPLLLLRWPAPLRGAMLTVLAGSLAVFAIGLLEDVRGASVFTRLAVEAAAAAMVFSAGLRIQFLTSPLGGTWDLGWLSLPATVLWIVLITNGMNFIDGHDGLAAGSAILILLTVILLAGAGLDRFMLLCILSLLGALGGFLRYNFPPATIFMGDGGSLFLGFFLASFAIAVNAGVPRSGSLWVTMLAFALPLLDMGCAILRRWHRGVSLFAPDAEHLHHQLVKRGLGKRRVLLFFYGINVVLLLTLVLFFRLRLPALPRLLVFFLLSFGAFLSLQNLADVRPTAFLNRLLKAIRRQLQANETEKAEAATAGGLPAPPHAGQRMDLGVGFFLSLAAAGLVLFAIAGDFLGLATGSVKLRAVGLAAVLLFLAQGLPRLARFAKRSLSPRSGSGERLRNGSSRASGLLSIAVKLGLLVLVLREFRIETPAFYDRLLPLTFVGFFPHQLLPLRRRQPFFAVLSLVGIIIILGVGPGASLIAVGTLLISLCHLPLPFRARLSVLALAGILLASWRILPRLPHPVWPILGSMFMFRLFLYLHDLRHARPRFDPFRSLAYFFMLPNVVFPLFPVVDHEKFRRGFFARESFTIAERGLRWLLYGLLHLLAYRWIKGSLLVSPVAIDGLLPLLRYLVANFLLILRVSGQFLLATGILLLFGYDLPRVMGNFLAAPSFAEFWRRANVYWHDFMLKTVYLPVFARLRGKPFRKRMLAATAAVFLATWVLHSWQWFWLRGTFTLRFQDLIFWGLFGVLVAAGQLRQASGLPTPAPGKSKGPAADFLTRALKIVAVMAGIVVLWSIWTASSPSAWMTMWLLPGKGVSWRALLVAMAAMVVALALGAIRHLLKERTAAAGTPPPPARSMAGPLGLVPLLAVFIASQPGAYSALGTACSRFMGELKIDRPSVRDRELMLRWYYEGLHDSALYDSELWRFYNAEWPAAWGNQFIMRNREGFLHNELRPGFRAEFRGAWLTTNRWGLRDRKYEERPGPGVLRVALLGASVDMGSGVGDGQTYEAILEDRLNRGSGEATRVEILNFAVDGYDPLRRLMVLEEKVPPFRPRMVWYAAHPDVDMSLLEDHLLRTRRLRVEAPYAFIGRLLPEFAGGGGMPAEDLAARLEANRGKVLAAVYSRLAAVCREHSLDVYCLIVPEPWGIVAERIRGEIRAARAAGLKVLDLSRAFVGRDPESLNVAPWDFHPNPLGHRLLAEELYRQVMIKGLLR